MKLQEISYKPAITFRINKSLPYSDGHQKALINFLLGSRDQRICIRKDG
jgi:hypothetical protein